MRLGSGFKQRIAVGVVCVLIFLYTVYHIVGIFGEDVTTYAAGITTESNVLSYTGYIFRDEKVLTSNNKGLTKYLVSDGTKVAEGQKLAVVYEKNQGEQNYIAKLDEYISILESGADGNVGKVDIEDQRDTNDGAYDAIIKLLSDGSTTGLDYQAQKLLIGMNIVDGLMHSDNTSSSELLARFKSERDRVFSASGSSVTCSAANSGYFFSGVDGCESYFTLDAAENITLSDFAKLTDRAMTAKPKDEAYGKFSYSSEWAIVLPVKRDDIKNFETGKTYSALFAENSKTSLPLLLENIVIEDGSDTCLLVFSCDRQPEGFKFDRCQSVSITVDTVSGIYVPKNVVVREDGKKGVYILLGSVVYFRYMEVLYEGNDYYLVRADSENDETHTYIRENDMIILTGQNLFDGRVLD